MPEISQQQKNDIRKVINNNMDLYALLEISPKATFEEIRKAYRQSALRAHPDKIKLNTKQNEGETDDVYTARLNSKFLKLGVALEILGDKDTRKYYDRLKSQTSRNSSKTTQPSNAPFSKFNAQPKPAKPPVYSSPEEEKEIITLRNTCTILEDMLHRSSGVFSSRESSEQIANPKNIKDLQRTYELLQLKETTLDALFEFRDSQAYKSTANNNRDPQMDQFVNTQIRAIMGSTDKSSLESINKTLSDLKNDHIHEEISKQIEFLKQKSKKSTFLGVDLRPSAANKVQAILTTMGTVPVLQRYAVLNKLTEKDFKDNYLNAKVINAAQTALARHRGLTIHTAKNKDDTVDESKAPSSFKILKDRFNSSSKQKKNPDGHDADEEHDTQNKL